MAKPENSQLAPKIVALIGHSAAGKSTCLACLEATPHADMDVALGTHESPSVVAALNWLSDASRPAIVVVSNHEEMLEAMRAAKLSDEHSDQFGRICLVYLFKPKDRLERHLAKPTADGCSRPRNHQEYTLQHYDRFHRLFTDLADKVINCSTASAADVAQQVREISSQLN